MPPRAAPQRDLSRGRPTGRHCGARADTPPSADWTQCDASGGPQRARRWMVGREQRTGSGGTRRHACGHARPDLRRRPQRLQRPDSQCGVRLAICAARPPPTRHRVCCCRVAGLVTPRAVAVRRMALAGAVRSASAIRSPQTASALGQSRRKPANAPHRCTANYCAARGARSAASAPPPAAPTPARPPLRSLSALVGLRSAPSRRRIV
jgi:hypothetical protein